MDIKHAAVYGSGVIGSGWATNFLMAGLEVSLYDVREELLATARKQIEHNLQFLMEEGLFRQDCYESTMGRLLCTTNPAIALEHAEFIQENTPENLSLKQEIVSVIELYCKSNAIIASSTSGLLISDIAAKAANPARFVGGHPYNPVYLIPLVEVTKGARTDDSAVQSAVDFYTMVKKEPVVLRKESLGFIANRLQVALMREAIDLVNNGVCSMDEVERASCFGPGLRYGLLGPLTINQLASGDKGLAGHFRHIGATIPLWWKDMANWTDWPDGFIDKCQVLIDESIAARDDLHGRTYEEMTLFRDRGLVKLLQHHGKL